MDISSIAICRFLYVRDTDAESVLLTPEFDKKWGVLKDGHFQQSRELRESTERWIAQRLSIDNEVEHWV